MALTSRERVARHRAALKQLTPIQRVISEIKYTAEQKTKAACINEHINKAQELAEELNREMIDRLKSENHNIDNVNGYTTVRLKKY